MIAETVLETKTDRKIPNSSLNEVSVFLRTLRLSLNLVTNILIASTVFACLLYAWPSQKVNAFQLHIILCVLGYQFFMAQGILVLSIFNSWSMHIARRQRRILHGIFQVLGILLVAAGSIVMMKENSAYFDTCHGILGLAALIMGFIGFSNGLLAYYAKLTNFIEVKWTKLIHYVTGIGILILSAACLCLGFEKTSFRNWAGDGGVIMLEVITVIFTILVAMDFILNTSRMFRNSFTRSRQIET